MDNQVNEIKSKLFYSENFLCGMCHDFDSKITLFNDYHASQHLFDYWSFVHILFGIILGLIFKNFIIILIVSCAFELIENSFFGVSLWKNLGVSASINSFNYDTYINIIGDTICVLMGFYISKLGIKQSLYAITVIMFILSLSIIFDQNSSILMFISKFMKAHKLYTSY